MSAATTTQKPTHLRRQTSLGSIHSVNQSIGENIQVVVRVRPQDQSDAPPSWQVSPDASSIICIDSDEIGDEPDQLDAALRYSFDRVFEAGISTAELYHSTIEPMLDSFLSGINGTVMTYGQTGSGKTFTLSGTSSNPGVSILLVQDLIGRIHQPDQYNSSYQLQVSYFEIYNEEVFDLLASKTRKGESLRIRENADGVYIEGLNKRNVSNIDEVHQLLKRGAQNRSVAATIWNRESSRSHSILSIELEVYRREHEDIEIRRRSVLNVVDLAGSERIAKYSTDKSLDAIVRQKEGGNINKSLYSLASVVSHLAQGSSHIPYRNSRLTRILQPSLGGNSRTLICVCVSAAKHNIHETISSLKFAALAKTIHNEYSVNISSAKTTGTARLRETSSDCSSISVALDPSAGQNGLASDQIRQELERTQVEYDRMRRSVQETVQILNEAIDSMSHGDELALSLNQDQFADAIRPLISSLCLIFNQYSTSQIRSKQLNDELQRACSTLLQYSGMLQKRLGHFRKTVANVTEELNHQDDYAMKTLCIDLKDQQIKYQNHRDIMNQVLQQYENRCNVLSLLLNHQTIKWSRDCYRMHRIQEMCRLCLTHLDLDRVKRHYHQIRKDHDSVIEQLGSLIMESCSSNWSTYRNPRLISIDLHESYQTQLDHYEMALHYRDQCVMKLDRERIMLRQELRRACSQIDNIRKQYKVKFDHLKAEQAQTCNLYEKTLLDNDLLQNKLESLGQRHLQTKDEYHRQIESLSSQNASLLVSYTALSEESDELKKEIQAQLQRNSELESTETSLRKDLQLSCAREQDHVQGQRQQSEQLERLRVSEANLKDSIKHLQDQVDGFHEEQHRDRLLIEKLRSSEMNLRQGLESAQIRQGQMQLDFDAKIRNLTDQESKLRQSVADHEQNEHRLNENIRTLTQEKLGLSEENQGHELKQISLLKKIESLSSSERDLRRINEDREVEQRRLLEQIKAMKEAEIDLRSQIQILEDKNLILCHSVNIGRQKEQNLISHCEEIQKEMETLNQQCQRRSEQYQAAQNQIQSLHRDREAQTFALKHQHEEFVQKLVHDHDDAVNELRKHIQTLTTRAVELQSKYSDVQMQNEEIHAVYAALQERFDVQKQRVEELQDQLTKSEAERVSLHISETGLQQRLQILANESVLQLAQHDKELLDLRDRLQQTRNQLIAEERRAGQYQTDLDKQCQELKELARALDQSQAFLTEMNREFDQSSGRVKELEHSLQLTRMQSQDHIYELQQQLQDSKRLHQQLDQDLSQLRADYNRLAEDRDQFRAQCQDTSISRDQLQTLLEKKEQDLADSATRQSQLQAQIDDLSNQCHDLRAELQNTKISARRAANDLKRDKIRSDTAHSIKLAQLRNEIEMFNSENNDLSAELALSKALLGFQKNVIESGSGTSSGKRTPRLHSRSSSISPRPLSGAISSSIPESDSNKPSSTALP